MITAAVVIHVRAGHEVSDMLGGLAIYVAATLFFVAIARAITRARVKRQSPPPARPVAPPPPPASRQPDGAQRIAPPMPASAARPFSHPCRSCQRWDGLRRDTAGDAYCVYCVFC